MQQHPVDQNLRFFSSLNNDGSVAKESTCNPETQEIQVQLGWEDPLGKEMATRSSILA